MKRLLLLCTATLLIGFAYTQTETFEQKITAEHSNIVVNGGNHAVTYITETSKTVDADGVEHATLTRDVIIDGKVFSIPDNPVFKKLQFKDARDLAVGKAISVTIIEEKGRPFQLKHVLRGWWTTRTIATDQVITLDNGQFVVRSSEPKNTQNTKWIWLIITTVVVLFCLFVAARDFESDIMSVIFSFFSLLVIGLGIVGAFIRDSIYDIDAPGYGNMTLSLAIIWVIIMPAAFFLGEWVRATKKKWKEKKLKTSTVSS